MSTTSPERSAAQAAPEDDAGEEDQVEGVTSEQVLHAQDESRAEGEPYEDAE
ncbi:hypothetical protein GCM10009665_55650 [Kitasatospora nipponensis]|uniref:Uncharacterized protein n=1 Tax=Kitasatospora nipponensis TaxID=258049 RepID=A0ABN1WRR8_9ACTN